MRLKCDLCTWVGAYDLGVVSPPGCLGLLDGSLAIEDATFTRLGLNQAEPLLHEQLHCWTFRVGGRVVGKCPLWVVDPPLTVLGSPHTIIGEIGQADQCAATNTSNHNDVGNLADQVMALDRGELAAHCAFEGINGELEEVDQRLGTTCAATKYFELLSCWANT